MNVESNSPNQLDKWWKSIDTHDKKEELYGDQNLYHDLFNTSVATLEKALKSAIKQNFPNYNTPFYHLYSLIGQLRNKIAVTMKSDDCEYFGQFRHSPIINTIAQNTHLIPEDKQKWNQEMSLRLWKTVQLLLSQKKTVDITESSLTRITVTIYDAKALISLKQKTDRILARRLKPQNHDTQEDLARKFTHQADLMNCLYGVHKLIADMNIPEVKSGDFPNTGNLSFIVETVEIKVQDYWSIASRNITWICQEKLATLEERTQKIFNDWAWVCILHTPSINITEHFVAAGLTFDALIKTPNNRPQLMKELEYRLFHMMLFFRGSASATEILMAALANVLNIKRNKPCDMAAFSQPNFDKYG